MAGGRPASGPAPFDRQRWLAALAVVALLGAFGAVLGKRLGTGGGLVAQTGGGSGSGGGGAAGSSGPRHHGTEVAADHVDAHAVDDPAESPEAGRSDPGGGLPRRCPAVP